MCCAMVPTSFSWETHPSVIINSFNFIIASVIEVNLFINGLTMLKMLKIADFGSERSMLSFMNLMWQVIDILMEVIQMVPKDTLST